ncbi:hypothetical protein LXA43DRAFT_1064059 [Ganoderma leucocontextum]|nr:hypothetical protein LXA43DRAFT_1064059 [Ganoderma leucocontextum]
MPNSSEPSTPNQPLKIPRRVLARKTTSTLLTDLVAARMHHAREGSKKCENIVEVIDKLVEHTSIIEMTVLSFNDVNVGFEKLVESVKALDQDIDLRLTKFKVVKVKELIEHVHMQLQQDQQMRNVHQSEYQAWLPVIAEHLYIIIKLLSASETK